LIVPFVFLAAALHLASSGFGLKKLIGVVIGVVALLPEFHVEINLTSFSPILTHQPNCPHLHLLGMTKNRVTDVGEVIGLVGLLFAFQRIPF
jgi:hypothetical protein